MLSDSPSNFLADGSDEYLFVSLFTLYPVTLKVKDYH